jgi:hypothetical protein
MPESYVKGRALVIYWSFQPDAAGNPFASTRWERLLRQIR